MLKTVLIDEELRKRIVEYLNPKEDNFFSYQNLDLLTAVYDDENDLYLVMSYYLSESIKRVGDNFDDYSYIVSSGDNMFTVNCRKYCGGNIEISKSDIPNEDIIHSAIVLRNENYRERRMLHKKLKEEQGIDSFNFTTEYLKANYWNDKQ